MAPPPSSSSRSQPISPDLGSVLIVTHYRGEREDVSANTHGCELVEGVQSWNDGVGPPTIQADIMTKRQSLTSQADITIPISQEGGSGLVGAVFG